MFPDVPSAAAECEVRRVLILCDQRSGLWNVRIMGLIGARSDRTLGYRDRIESIGEALEYVSLMMERYEGDDEQFQGSGGDQDSTKGKK